jgi:hypothetical protein
MKNLKTGTVVFSVATATIFGVMGVLRWIEWNVAVADQAGAYLSLAVIVPAVAFGLFIVAKVIFSPSDSSPSAYGTEGRASTAQAHQAKHLR